MNTTSFFSDMLQTIAEQGKRFLSRAPVAADVSPAERLGALCEALLSSRGEASGVALAQDILDRWQTCDAAEKRDFMRLLLDRFGPSTDRVEAAIAAYQAQPGAGALLELHNAAEPRRQELLRRLNLAPHGISTLVRMRETLLQLKAKESDLDAVDADGEGKQEFRIAAALAFCLERHRRLAAGKDQHRLAERPVPRRHLAGDRRMHEAHLARLALDGIGQDDGLYALPLRFVRGGFQGHGRRGDEMHIVA